MFVNAAAYAVDANSNSCNKTNHYSTFSTYAPFLLFFFYFHLSSSPLALIFHLFSPLPKHTRVIDAKVKLVSMLKLEG